MFSRNLNNCWRISFLIFVGLRISNGKILLGTKVDDRETWLGLLRLWYVKGGQLSLIIRILKSTKRFARKFRHFDAVFAINGRKINRRKLLMRLIMLLILLLLLFCIFFIENQSWTWRRFIDFITKVILGLIYVLFLRWCILNETLILCLVLVIIMVFSFTY